MTRKIVLSGGPGVGKTSIVQELSKKHTVLNEIYTQLCETAALKQIHLETQTPGFFCEMIGSQWLQEQKALPKIVFCDRSLVDIVAFAEYYKINIHSIITKLNVNLHGYDQCVIFPDALPSELYHHTQCTYEESLKIHQFLKDFYTRYGYTIVELPFASVATRANNILRALKETK